MTIAIAEVCHDRLVCVLKRYFIPGDVRTQRRLEIDPALVYRLDLGKNRAETIHDGLCIDIRGGYP